MAKPTKAPKKKHVETKKVAKKVAAKKAHAKVEEKVVKLPKPGTTVLTDKQHESAEDYGFDAVHKKVDGEHVVTLTLGEWEFDLDVKDEAAARSMAVGLFKALDAAVEARVEKVLAEREREAKKAAKAAKKAA